MKYEILYYSNCKSVFIGYDGVFSCIVLSVKLFFVDIYKIFKYIESICIGICILIGKY